MLTALALAAMASTDAGLPPAVYAEKAQLLLPGGWVESECADADGGCSGVWEPTPRAVALEKDRADKTAQNEVLRATPKLFSPETWVFIVFTNVLTALAVGYAVWSLVRFVDGH